MGYLSHVRRQAIIRTNAELLWDETIDNEIPIDTKMFSRKPFTNNNVLQLSIQAEVLVILMHSFTHWESPKSGNDEHKIQYYPKLFQDFLFAI